MDKVIYFDIGNFNNKYVGFRAKIKDIIVKRGYIYNEVLRCFVITEEQLNLFFKKYKRYMSSDTIELLRRQRT